MILVEGSSMIFQAIQDLPPGYHQYKFLVDGVWRFDGQQICVPDEYGRINNVVLVNELASSSSSIHPELVLPWSDNMIDVSRHHLSLHLSSYKTFELIPNSGKVIALDAKVAMEQACHVMYEEGLAVVPIWDDCSKQILGMLTASDFILIFMELHRNRPMVINEQLEMHTISAWKEVKFQLHREAVGPTQLLHRRPLIQAGPDESLKDVALRILQNKISTVPVIHSMQDGSCPQLLHIACLSGILKYMCRLLRQRLGNLPLLQQPIGTLHLGTWREVGRSGRVLLSLRPTDPLSSALNLLIEGKISSVPIVDDKGALINVYSRSDITSLAKGNVYARIQLDQTIMSQALELIDEANHHRYGTCTHSDPLYRIMELLSDPAVRRVIVTNAGSQRVEGIITLRDVFNFILI
ncbi:sucrose nonfermenting 4-like protein isoform X2 [Cornus florida]|nr:sucrose nonfermenting 4-like protein isoform X2 [Cornus florida]